MFKSGDDLDTVVSSRKFKLPFKDNVLLSPSRKNMPYGDAFTGLAADFYLWNRTLSTTEMQKYTTDCTHIPDKTGLIIDWSKIELNKSYSAEVVTNVDVCKSRLGTGESSVGVIPIEVSFAEAETNCLRMGGRLADHHEADFVDLMARADPTGIKCSSQLWAPYQKSPRTNTLFNTNTKETFLTKEAEFSWHPGQPNGGDLETCLTIHIINNTETVWDDDCEETHCCFACHFAHLPKVTLRGDICSNDRIDRDYFLVTYKAAIFFRGFFGTVLQLDENGNQWELISDTIGIIGHISGKEVTPMGKRWLSFSNISAATCNASLIKTTQVAKHVGIV